MQRNEKYSFFSRDSRIPWYILARDSPGQVVGLLFHALKWFQVREFERSAGIRTNCSALTVYLFFAKLFLFTVSFPFRFVGVPRAWVAVWNTPYTRRSSRSCRIFATRIDLSAGIPFRNRPNKKAASEPARSFIYSLTYSRRGSFVGSIDFPLSSLSNLALYPWENSSGSGITIWINEEDFIAQDRPFCDRAMKVRAVELGSKGKEFVRQCKYSPRQDWLFPFNFRLNINL